MISGMSSTPHRDAAAIGRFLIIDNQQARQTLDDYLCGRWIVVRMKPERRRRLMIESWVRHDFPGAMT